MRLKVIIAVIIIIQAALLLSYAYNSYLDYGGAITVSTETDIDNLLSILDSKGIPYVVDRNGSKYTFKTTVKLVHLLEDECTEYYPVEPIYQRSHRNLFFITLFETIIIMLYFLYCCNSLTDMRFRNTLLFLCYVVIIMFLRVLRIYPCWI